MALPLIQNNLPSLKALCYWPEHRLSTCLFLIMKLATYTNAQDNGPPRRQTQLVLNKLLYNMINMIFNDGHGITCNIKRTWQNGITLMTHDCLHRGRFIISNVLICLISYWITDKFPIISITYHSQLIHSRIIGYMQDLNWFIDSPLLTLRYLVSWKEVFKALFDICYQILL